MKKVWIVTAYNHGNALYYKLFKDKRNAIKFMKESRWECTLEHKRIY